MNPLLQEKLLDLLVNVVAIIIGGGLITVVIEWRRHKRERQNWQREDAIIQIDIPEANISAWEWKITDKTSDKDKLVIYENQLEKTIRSFVIYAEFVIRNTTATEIIVTSYDLEPLNIPDFYSRLPQFYDSEHFDPVESRGVIRLMPYASIPRAVVYFATFNKDRKLEREALPKSITISVKTSSGKVIQNLSDLRVVGITLGLMWYEDTYVPRRYYDKIRRLPVEDDIPF